jgi:DNA polymerase/3'-5' exonuclease PolX
MRKHDPVDADGALTAVDEVLAEIGPGLARSSIAGSLRRELPVVHDIEIVIELPEQKGVDLFGEFYNHADSSRYEAGMESLIQQRRLAWDEEVRRRGAKYQRFVLPHLNNLPFEIFIADEHNWGNTLAIRTGDAQFSRLLVTSKDLGGFRPTNCFQADGYLWHVPGGPDNLSRISCFTEEGFFAALATDWIAPHDRNGHVWQQKLQKKRLQERHP